MNRFLKFYLNDTYFIFFITILSCILVNSGSLSSSDAAGRLQATHWLWRNVPQVLPPRHDITGVQGKQFAQWGIGQSLLMLPADMLSWPFVSLLHPGHLRDEVQTGLISYLTFPLFDAFTVIIAYRLLLELQFSRSESALGAIGLLFGTSFLPYTQIQQENSLMFFSLIGGFLGNILWLRTQKLRHLFFGVFCLGWGLLVRLPCAFDAFIVVFFVIISIASKPCGWPETLRKVAEFVFWFGVFYLPFVVADRFYEWIRFGSITSTYFAIQEAQARASNPLLPKSFPFSTPFIVGFTGFLFSPNKSIFEFNPLLLLTTIVLVRYRSAFEIQTKRYVVFAWLLLIIQISFYARLTFWGGDTAWGPRYVLAASQCVALIAIPAFVRIYSNIRTIFEKLTYAILAVLSCIIQIVSVLYDPNLEILQEGTFHVKYFIVWQRAFNAWSLSVGTWQTSGLDPGLAHLGFNKFAILAFMPWRTEGEIPHRLSVILQIGWEVGFCSLVALLIVFFVRLRKEFSREMARNLR